MSSKFRKKEDDKKRQLLGEAVCGFVNPETTDEACFAILTGIQNIWGYNSSFMEEVKKVFPAMSNITPQPKNLQEEWNEISSLEDRVLSDLREKLGPPFDLTCNRHDQSFVLSVPQSKIKDFLELHYSKQELLLRALSKPGADLRWDSGLPRFYPTAELDVHYEFETHTAKVSVFDPHPEYRSAMSDMVNLQLKLQKSWTRFNTTVLHERVQAQQENMRRIFDALTNGKPIKEDYRLADSKPGYALSQYLKIYNEMPKYIVEVCQQDSLDKLYPTREEDYYSINLPLKWLDRLKSDLAYCLIEFLLSGYQKSLKRCDVCSKFLVHPTRKRCSDECRRIATKQYDTEYKQFVRLEQFVDDVKEKCKKADDLYLGENRKLLARMRKFRLPENEVIERLKKDLKEDS